MHDYIISKYNNIKRLSWRTIPIWRFQVTTKRLNSNIVMIFVVFTAMLLAHEEGVDENFMS